MSGAQDPGPPRIDAAAFAPPNPSDRPAAPAPGAASKKTVVVSVGEELLVRLRTRCATWQRSPTEVILTSHLELSEQLGEELRPTVSDQRRIALGLPQAAASRRLGPGRPLSLWLSPVSLAELDAAARAVGITRRRYITALIEALLARADEPA